MNNSEKETEYFILDLLKDKKIPYKGSPHHQFIVPEYIEKALSNSSKNGTDHIGIPDAIAGFPEKPYIYIFEYKKDTKYQRKLNDDGLLSLEPKDIQNYAENGAYHYARHIVMNTSGYKVFAFGCTGNKENYIIQPYYVYKNENNQIINKKLDPIQNFEAFSKDHIEEYYKVNVLGEKSFEQTTDEEILTYASNLHEMLRNYGQLGDSEKPLVVSAILLALKETYEKNIDITSNLRGNTNPNDGKVLYRLISDFLEDKIKDFSKKDKILTQFQFIKERPILNKVNSSINKTPILYFVEYINQHIFKRFSDSKEDILGKFYGEFVRYSGGNQSLGVVLTPSHITELCCELMNLTTEDIIFDPCCGTGGFLVSSLSYLINKVNRDEFLHNHEKDLEIQKIKSTSIYGMDIREDMFTIAVTNMILRGDGNSNLFCDNFLTYDLNQLNEKKFTIGFMNPPYSQAKKKDISHLSELSFIEKLVDCIGDGGKCIVLVPLSSMCGKNTYDKEIKKRLLQKHTLKGVITLNKNTFYGIGIETCLAIFIAHRPHPKDYNCKFINFENDGYEVYKHRGLIKTKLANDLKKKLLNCWHNNERFDSKFVIETKITHDDEWIHSFFYFNEEEPLEEDFENVMNDYLNFEFEMISQGKEYLFENNEEGI